MRAAVLEYRAVGFGSHHWVATDPAGVRLFVTADDLTAKLMTAGDTTDAAFGRLAVAFETARALHADAGLSFVVAPLPTARGQVVVRLTGRYSLVVHPYVAGRAAGADGEYASDDDRRTILDILTRLHRAQAGQPRADNFVVPNLDALEIMMRETNERWRGGPYGEPAADLLRTHAADLRLLVRAYSGLARRVSSRPERMVITHGEPHASNVIVTAGGLVLVDWESVLLAPPERDLWDLAEHDRSLLGRYAAATGTQPDDEALTLYRLWYDLSEIGGYLSLFRAAHEDTADTVQSWANLRHFLRPAERWPALVRAA